MPAVLRYLARFGSLADYWTDSSSMSASGGKAAVQIPQNQRIPRSAFGQLRTLKIRIDCLIAQRPARPCKVLGLRLLLTEPGLESK